MVSYVSNMSSWSWPVIGSIYGLALVGIWFTATARPVDEVVLNRSRPVVLFRST